MNGLQMWDDESILVKSNFDYFRSTKRATSFAGQSGSVSVPCRATRVVALRLFDAPERAFAKVSQDTQDAESEDSPPHSSASTIQSS